MRIEHVTKSFDDVVAVDDLDLAVEEGQFVTFLGPSGCGKSTTLRLLGGFEVPDSGRIHLGDDDVTRTPPNRRDVNMVFQDYALFPHMTVERNIAFGLELKGRGRGEITRRIDELTDFLGLADLRARMPDQLSGGQRQRVALARALAPDPRLLLLDEPLGALDAKLRGQVQVELKAIQRRTGKTFVFVTHDQEEALTMSDRIVVMNAGRIEQDGTPEDLYRRPVSRFVADFIGETNLFVGTILDNRSGLVTIEWPSVGRVIAGSTTDHPPGASITLALRPESIVCRPAEPDLANRFEGRIRQRIFKGPRTTLEIEVGHETLTAAIDPATAATLTDDRLWLGWPPEAVAVLRD
ncbi:MAG: ABC transporter ATP-binding protein [Geminicoccaceae bacterium]|nr:ABC transporter ATP-binding protein [Geminicoccaceae bacterium]